MILQYVIKRVSISLIFTSLAALPTIVRFTDAAQTLGERSPMLQLELWKSPQYARKAASTFSTSWLREDISSLTAAESVILPCLQYWVKLSIASCQRNEHKEHGSDLVDLRWCHIKDRARRGDQAQQSSEERSLNNDVCTFHHFALCTQYSIAFSIPNR